MNLHQLGAHEVIELHEVLNEAINGINLLSLYQPHVRDEELMNILNRQLRFMTLEYNHLLSMSEEQSRDKSISNYTREIEFLPRYGLDQPQQFYPKESESTITDRDIASGMLGCHKSSAIKKMIASLECANQNLREALFQGAKNCSDQAYEVFEYMNKRGIYQVPILSNQDEILHQYQEAPSTFGFNMTVQ